MIKDSLYVNTVIKLLILIHECILFNRRDKDT